jgi:hypothetical protein
MPRHYIFGRSGAGATVHDCIGRRMARRRNQGIPVLLSGIQCSDAPLPWAGEGSTQFSLTRHSATPAPTRPAWRPPKSYRLLQQWGPLVRMRSATVSAWDYCVVDARLSIGARYDRKDQACSQRTYGGLSSQHTREERSDDTGPSTNDAAGRIPPATGAPVRAAYTPSRNWLAARNRGVASRLPRAAIDTGPSWRHACTEIRLGLRFRSSPHRWVHAGARHAKRAARVAAAPSCDPGRHFVGAAVNDRCLAVAQPCPASAPRRRLHGLARVGDGGQVLVYVVMASWPSGATAGRLYLLTTQADGCVASFQGTLTSILPQEEA